MSGGREVKPDEFLAAGARFEKVDAQEGRKLERVDLFEYLTDFKVSYASRGRVRVKEFFVTADGEWVGLRMRGSTKQYIRRFYDAGSERFRALLRVMGAYLAEGSASIRKLTATRDMFSIGQSDPDWLAPLQKDLASFTQGVETDLMPTGGGMWAIRSGAALLPYAFAALCGFRSSGKRFPDFVYDLADDDFAEMKRPMVEGDGHVVEPDVWRSRALRRSPGHEFSYTTKSQVLMAGFSYALDQRGFEHAIHYRPEKRCWTLRTRPTGTERPNRQRVLVSRRKAEDEWVYDLTVEGAHTFVDGIGRVLLHNTDSIYVKGPTKAEFEAFTKWCNEELYPPLMKQVGCPRNVVNLEYEKEFERIVFVTAKRYAGWYKHFKGNAPKADAKPEVKGLEYKRGDSTKLARDLQVRVVEMLLKGEEGMEAFHELLSHARQHVLEDALPLAEVVMRKELSKALREYAVKKKKDGEDAAQSPHVVVAKMLKARGQDVSAGTRVGYVVLDDEAEDPAKRFMPEEDYKGECDRHYVWQSLVYPPTMRLLEAAFPDADAVKHWEAWAKSRPSKKALKALEQGQGALFKSEETRVSPTGLRTTAPPTLASTQPYEAVVDQDKLEAAGGLEVLLAVAQRHPGKRMLKLRLRLDTGAEAAMDTAVRVDGGGALARKLALFRHVAAS
jgi:hypothetical protein